MNPGTSVPTGFRAVRVIAACLACALAISAARAAGPIQLHDVTAETGIRCKHRDGSSARRYIVETVASGLATFDYDGDGKIDIYFLSGTPLPGAKPDPNAGNRLYRNLGGWKFVDVTDKAGVGRAGYGLGVAVGDYDNDGRPDIYVNNFGPNVLFHNRGDGTFADATRQTGTAAAKPRKVGAGACFLDIDGDGRLDLYVANYLEFSFDNHRPTMTSGIPVYAGPSRYRPMPDILYRNQGDGTFADVSAESGVGKHAGWGMGVVCADIDGDGATDIFVANDVAKNFLFKNDGTGRFKEVGLTAGIAYDFAGSGQGSMGVDCGDYDNDGRLDFYVTSYQRQLSLLYRNLGNGLFEDVTHASGAGSGTLPHVTWGCGFVDFDNDGYRDIFVACGHLQDNVELYDDTASYHARNILLRNQGDGTFANLSDQAGDGMLAKRSSRGAAFDDLDNDGDIDVVILNSRDCPTILRNMLNENGSKNGWLDIHLRGVKTNRDGIGAQVRVVAGNLSQLDEVHSGRGYQSHFGSRLHFGLGKRDRVDRVEVRWIGGGIDIIEHVAAGQLLTIVEGSGSAAQVLEPIVGRDHAVWSGRRPTKSKTDGPALAARVGPTPGFSTN